MLYLVKRLKDETLEYFKIIFNITSKRTIGPMDDTLVISTTDCQPELDVTQL